MPVKAKRALLNRSDGTIYCNPGTVLADDDPVALANVNAIVGTSEPVTPGFEREKFTFKDLDKIDEVLAAPEQIERDLVIEQTASDAEVEEEDDITDEVEDEPEEEDEGVTL